MPLTGAQQIIHFQDPSIRIVEIPELQLIVVQGNGEVPSVQYRQGLSIAVEVAIQNKLLYWMVNNRVSGIISPADQIWSNEVIAPRIAAETRIRKMAFIKPKDVLSTIILENMMDQARDVFHFDMQFFDLVSNAIRWFKDTSDNLY